MNVHHIVTGPAKGIGAAIEMADVATRESRLAMCQACEHYRVAIGQCKLCGCFMPAKVFLKAKACPDGRW